MRFFTALTVSLFALLFVPALASAQIAVPSGLPFQVSKVPNLERDCGRTAATAPTQPADPNGVNPASPNPLTGASFFVDPTERSYKDMMIYKSRGQADKANAMANLAMQPKARWMGRFTRPRMQRKVRNYLNCVQVFQPGATPLIVVMRHQGIACNNKYDGGGVAEDNRTKKWYRDFAEAIGNRRAVLAFEPDGIGTINCLKKSRRKSRMDLFRYGVDVLSKLPNATIYLEGTASDWKPARWTARMLRYMGVSKVRGFMLNVTHHDWTYKNVAYGRKVSRMVGGKPFVISTSYNGRGPVHYKLGRKGRYRRVNVFCNPRYRGLGPKPNVNTQLAGVDAFLYLNRPGVSGAGTCNGGFKAGEWWPERALMYSKFATEWYGPPKGTRFGFPAAHLAVRPGRARQGRAGLQLGISGEALRPRQPRQPVATCKRGGAGPFWPDASSRLRAGRGLSPCSCPRPTAQAQRPDPLKVPDLFRPCGTATSAGPKLPADPRGTNPSSPNPLAGDSFFVDPSEQSAKDLVAYQRAGRKRDAAAIAKLALRPKARWLGAYTRPNMPLKVRNYLNCVQVFQPGATPVFTVLRHQGKQCNAALRRRGRGRGQRHQGLVPRPGRGHRRPARGHRLRARLDRHDRVPGALAPSSPQGSAALRRRRSIQAPQRHDLPGGHRLRLEERALHRVACCATSAWPRCAASCST